MEFVIAVKRACRAEHTVEEAVNKISDIVRINNSETYTGFGGVSNKRIFVEFDRDKENEVRSRISDWCYIEKVIPHLSDSRPTDLRAISNALEGDSMGALYAALDRDAYEDDEEADGLSESERSALADGGFDLRPLSAEESVSFERMNKIRLKMRSFPNFAKYLNLKKHKKA